MPRRVRCPRCSTINIVADGAKPLCINCGFGSPGLAQQMAAMQAAGVPVQAPPGFATQVGSPKRPGLVTTVAVIGFILAGLYLLAGIFVAALGPDLVALLERQGYPGAAELEGSAFVAIGIGVAVYGALLLVAALFILKGKNWARILQTVLSALGMLSAVVNFPNGLLDLAIHAFLIVALFLPASSAYFAAKKQAAPPAYT